MDVLKFQNDEKLEEHFDWYFKCMRPSCNYLLYWLYMEESYDEKSVEEKKEEFYMMCEALASRMDPYLGGETASVIDILYYCEWTTVVKLKGVEEGRQPEKVNEWKEKMLEDYPILKQFDKDLDEEHQEERGQ